MILGKVYKGLETDIWSSGITLFAMVCGNLPFEVCKLIKIIYITLYRIRIMMLYMIKFLMEKYHSLVLFLKRAKIS